MQPNWPMPCLFQHGRGRRRAEVWRIRRAEPKAVLARRDQGRAQSQGRHGVRGLAEKDSGSAANAVFSGSIEGSRRFGRDGAGDVPVGDLGSGSDYSAFLQHLGVPSTDVGSTGSYGVYHSVFDNFDWFKKFADPDFLYEQQMARVFGLEALRMADADVLPYDYEEYGKEVGFYIDTARKVGKAGSATMRSI